MVDLAIFDQELDALEVSLGSAQMEARSTVIVTHVQVNVLKHK